MKAKRLIALLILLLPMFTGYGQKYQGEALLPKIEKDGFYRIPITSDLAAYLVPDFANLRIVGPSHQEIPYIFREEVPVRYGQEFHEYEMERKQIKNCCTEIVLKNPERSPINNIRLMIRNADVTKDAVLLGSDDRTNWFAIKEKFTLFPVDGGKGTYEMKVVDFPLSNYLFYSLRIADSTNAPISILKAGHYSATTENGQYTIVPGKVTYANNVKKQTQLRIDFDTLRLVDRIDLRMKGKQQYFLRRASIQKTLERKTKKGKVEKYQHIINEFEVSSTHPTQIEVAADKFREFQIVIENEDNPPLELVFLRAYQLNRYIVVWLSAGNVYAIKIGNPNVPPPSYDLRFFKDSIPTQVPILQAGKVTLPTKKISSSTFFNSNTFIWAAVVVVVLLLGYMAFKLTAELDKSSKG